MQGIWLKGRQRLSQVPLEWRSECLLNKDQIRLELREVAQEVRLPLWAAQSRERYRQVPDIDADHPYEHATYRRACLEWGGAMATCWVIG